MDAAAGPVAEEEGGEGRRDGKEPRTDVGHLDARQVPRGKLGEEARDGREVQVVSDPARVRPLGAEARERDDDEAGVQRGEALVPEIPSLERPGTEALDEDVRVARHLPERRGPGVRLQVERHRLHAAEEGEEPRPGPPDERRSEAHRIPRVRILHLDDARPEVDEGPRENGSREHPGDVQDDRPRQRERGVHGATFRNSLPNFVIAAMFETFTLPRRNAVSGACCPPSMAR